MDFLQNILPQRVLKKIVGKNIQRISLGRSGFEVFHIDRYGYIKVSADADALSCEKDRCLWLENRLIAPRVLDYGKCFGKYGNTSSRAFLLTSEVMGLPLCDESFLREPRRLIEMLGEAMALFHAMDATDCPFIAEGCQDDLENALKVVLCHGDFCLPNILFDGKNFGFVDLGGMGKGDPWLDYAWCLWSLDYNLKTAVFRPYLLQTLGIEFDKEKYGIYTAM